MTDERHHEQIPGDGGSERGSEEQLLRVKKEIDAIRNDLADSVVSSRHRNNQIRYCRWAGQSPDGRKRDALLGKALPFDGASDTRPFVADGIINFITAELVTAATRATPRDTGMEAGDARRGGFNSTLIKWLCRNQWHDYRRQVELAAQYAYGDSPGGSVFWIDWCEEREISLQKVSIEDVSSMISGMLGEEMTPDEEENLIDLITSEDRAEDLEALLGTFFPNLKPVRIRKIVRDLYRDEEAEFPLPRVKMAIPRMKALRLYRDIYFSRNVTDIQRAPMIIMADYYTEGQLREEAGKRGWRKPFLDDVLERGKGSSGFDDTAEMAPAEAVAQSGLDGEEELYEILTIYSRAVNDEGVPGVYWQTVSYFSDKPGTDRNLFDRAHGGYPCVFYAREALSACLVDSRGVPEIVSTDQNSIKLLDDSFEDHTQIATNPVRKVPRGYPVGSFRFQPCGTIEIGPREATSLGYIDPPKYPTANKDHYQRMRQKISEYWGIPLENVNERFMVNYSQNRVDTLLGALKQVFTMAIQLCHQYMEPEQLSRITGQDVESMDPMHSTRGEIQGKYDISLSFDVRDLDMEFLLKKVDVALKFRQIDADNRIDYSQIAVRAIESLDANWAQDAVRDLETANGIEAEAARDDLAKMLLGIKPDRPQDSRAQNFPLRLQVLQEELQMRQQNPQIFPEITPAAAALIEDQMSYLGFQTQQRENAITGRMGIQETDLNQLGAEMAGPVEPMPEQEMAMAGGMEGGYA